MLSINKEGKLGIEMFEINVNIYTDNKTKAINYLTLMPEIIESLDIVSKWFKDEKSIPKEEVEKFINNLRSCLNKY